MKRKPDLTMPWRLLSAAAVVVLGAIMAACGVPPKPAPPAVSIPTPPPPAPPPLAPPVAKPEPMTPASNASTAQAYRRDAARHLYSQNGHRIYSGKMPPLLYAVGVLQVDLDEKGHVSRLDWMRAPRQAPEVMAEIERTVRQAAPFPRPVRLGRVTYTDTWLWHKSGRFQLDTLTEGQL